MNRVLILGVPQKARNFLISWATTSFSRTSRFRRPTNTNNIIATNAVNSQNNRWPAHPQGRVQFNGSPCGICNRRAAMGQGLSYCFPWFLYQPPSHQCPIHSFHPMERCYWPNQSARNQISIHIQNFSSKTVGRKSFERTWKGILKKYNMSYLSAVVFLNMHLVAKNIQSRMLG